MEIQTCTLKPGNLHDHKRNRTFFPFSSLILSNQGEDGKLLEPHGLFSELTIEQRQHRGEAISLYSRRQKLGCSSLTSKSSTGRQKLTVNAHQGPR